MTEKRHEPPARSCRFSRAISGMGGAVRTVLIASMCLLLPFVAGAQDFSFPAGTAGEAAAAVEKALPALAGQVIAAYKEESRAAYLDNLFRLQIVAGRHADALRTLATLHELVVNPRSPQTAAYNVEDQIFARAKVIEGGDGTRDAFGRQAESIFGYRRDPAAHVDLVELRYQWFDYVFKGAPRPAVLRDRVNYEVTGANVWKHAPSVAAMSASKMRLHLTALKRGATYRLSEGKPARDGFITLTVNFADRSDVDKPSPGGGVLDKEVDSTNGLVFVSDPFTKPVEMSGLFSGRLGFITNKKDFDFEIDLYQMTPKGDYLQLAPYWARASYVRE